MGLEAINSLTVSEANEIAKYYEDDEDWDFWEFMRLSVRVYHHASGDIILMPTANYKNSQTYTQGH